MEAGEWQDNLRGTPQESVASPISANIYEHHVLDLWFQAKWRIHEANGDSVIVRYADDFVVGLPRQTGRGENPERSEEKGSED